MPGDLSPEAEAKIDLKLLKMEGRLYRKMKGEQSKYNDMIRDIHQEIVGYEKRAGIIERQNNHEVRLDDHEERIKIVEDKKAITIEKIKVKGLILAAFFGSGGLITVVVLFLLGLIGGTP